MPASDPEELRAHFREKLELFCFFHLGSDAQIRISGSQERLLINLAHHRIESFEFSLSQSQLEALVAEPSQLEQFLLGEITPHRR